MLQELIYKNIAIKNLIRRNKKRKAPSAAPPPKAEARFPKKQLKFKGSSLSAKDLPKKPESQLITFPFVVLVNEDKNNQISIQMNEKRKKMCIESEKKLNLYGDIDTLLKMRVHHEQKEFLGESVDASLRKFLPPEFVARETFKGE